MAPLNLPSVNTSASSSSTVSGGPLTPLVTSQTLHQVGADYTDILVASADLVSKLTESSSTTEGACPPLPPCPVETNQTGRPSRARRLPARFRDVFPEPPLPITTEDSTSVESDNSTPQNMLPRVILHVFDTICMSFNHFGIARLYRHRPSYDPDAFMSIEQLSNSHDDEASTSMPSTSYTPPLPPWPWKNMSIWRIMTWMMTGSRQKSEAEVTRLANMLQEDDFDPRDLQGFNAHTEMKHFDSSESALDESNPLRQDGWKESSVDIHVPTQERNPDGNGRQFTIGGLFHRPLTAVIRAVFAEKGAKWFHLTPFK